MRRKIIILGVGFALIAGAASLTGNGQPVVKDRPNSDNEQGYNPQSNPTEGGVVITDDETYDSPPRQISREEPAPSTVAFQPQKPRQRSDKIVIINNKEYPLRTYRTLALPNDPQANQWWVANAKFEPTWSMPAGSRQTVLAIIDTGFAMKHEEFENRLYVNPGESGSASSEMPSSLNCTARSLPLSADCNLIDDDRDGTVDNEYGYVSYQNPSRLNCSAQGKSLTKDCNRIDDDQNGHIDDVQGWDFLSNDNSAQAGELNPAGSGTTHGTQVAGVAAATGNNGKGIAGADWGTKILPIQALDDDAYGDTLSVGQAIYYAASQGADVISISLGSTFSDEYVREAVQAAIAGGSVVVASAGNDGCDCMVYPAAYPEVVGVGALNTSSQPASFSSWGKNLDIMAPGTGITSPTWTASNVSSGYTSNINGTSFAAPMVSGIITRLISHQPSATPLQLIAALTENSNRLTLPATTPQDTRLGFGTLDAYKASQRMTTARSYAQLNVFTPVRSGSYLAPQSPAEPPGTYVAHECQPGTVGTTPIHELTKYGSHFFSISQVEASMAERMGYISKPFAHACLRQPHDTTGVIRNIDMFREFRNIYKPL